MSLSTNRDVFITCAVTGSGNSTGRSDKVPLLPTVFSKLYGVRLCGW